MSLASPQIIDHAERMLLRCAQFVDRQEIVLSGFTHLGQPRTAGDVLGPYPERSVWNQGVYRSANPCSVLLGGDDVDRNLAHLNRIEYGFGNRHGLSGASCRNRLDRFGGS